MLKTYKELIDSVYTYQDSMVEMLHQFCTINSGTSNLEGLVLMRHTLEQAYSPLADTIQIEKMPSLAQVNLQGSVTTQDYGDATLSLCSTLREKYAKYLNLYYPIE